MSKLKKLAAGVLAAAICATSFAAPAPATADAADYCCHTIYRKSSVKVSTLSSTFCKNVPTGYGHWNDSGTAYYVHYKKCYLETYRYRDTYACYKCDYSYSSYRTVGPCHTVSH